MKREGNEGIAKEIFEKKWPQQQYGNLVGLIKDALDAKDAIARRKSNVPTR